MKFDYSLQPGLTDTGERYVKTAKPLVSIITPYYNAGRHFFQTFRCVMNQTFPFFEWIIVDDGSTNEEDVALLAEYAQKDPRIRAVRQENSGISAARNRGIREVQTDFILPLDADDLLEPTFLECCYWMLQKNPGAAWAYPACVGFGDDEYVWNVRFDPNRERGENILTNCALIRKAALERVGGYCEGQKHFNEDWYLWLRMLEEGCYPAQSLGDPLMWYRRHHSGVLTLVKEDRRIAKANRALIREEARKVKHPAPPVVFPDARTGEWSHPHKSDWTQSVYAKKTKKHVAFLLPYLVMGGADKFNLDLAEGLKRTGYDVSILTTRPAEHEWLQRFRAVTDNVFNLAHFLSPADYAEFLSYYIVSHEVDVLFLSNSYVGYFLLPWLREQFPDLVIVDYVHMEEWYWRSGGYARASAAVGGVTEKTYVCNTATEEVLRNTFGRKADSVQTVHIGVDSKRFDPATVPAGQFRAELKLPEDRPIVLFICRLHPQKRPYLMLKIAEETAKRVPGVAFAVVGSGPQEDALRMETKIRGLSQTVFFAGERSDVRPCYRDARLTLVCSLKEGLSLTAYESCAMGVPVISADVGGQRDLVDASVGALIPCLQSEAEQLDCRMFPEEEVNSYVDAIAQYLQDPKLWEKASRTCREKAEGEFSLEAMVQRFDREFNRLLEDESLRAARREASEALRRVSPASSELFTVGMQIECEDMAGAYGERSLLTKAKETLHNEGFAAFVKKTAKHMKDKAVWLIYR